MTGEVCSEGVSGLGQALGRESCVGLHILPFAAVHGLTLAVNLLCFCLGRHFIVLLPKGC